MSAYIAFFTTFEESKSCLSSKNNIVSEEWYVGEILERTPDVPLNKTYSSNYSTMDYDFFNLTSWTKILWDCFPQYQTQETWMDFFINRKRSEFVGRCKDEALGRSKAFFVAALSTFSFPGMPI